MVLVIGSGCCDTAHNIGQTQLHLSLLRRESRAAVLPPPLVLLDNNFKFHFDLVTTARRFSIHKIFGKLF